MATGVGGSSGELGATAEEGVPGTARVDEVECEPDCQVRVRMDPDHVADLAAALQAGEELPPVKCVSLPGRLLAYDGWHTLEAHKLAGRALVSVEVVPGDSEADAVWRAAGSNRRNSLKLTREDKARAVRLALLARPTAADREIARLVGVSHNTVKSHREAMGLASGEPRVGGDGKSYPGKRAPREAEDATPGGQIDHLTDDEGEAQEASPPARRRTARDADDADRYEPPAEPVAPAGSDPEAPLAEAPRDLIGLVVPVPLRPAFRTLEDLLRLDQLVYDLQRLVSEVATRPGAERLRQELSRRLVGSREQYHSPQLRDLRDILKATRPYASACPYCHHAGRVSPTCTACYGRDWVTQPAWEGAPGDYVRALMEERQL